MNGLTMTAVEESEETSPAADCVNDRRVEDMYLVYVARGVYISVHIRQGGVDTTHKGQLPRFGKFTAITVIALHF